MAYNFSRQDVDYEFTAMDWWDSLAHWFIKRDWKAKTQNVQHVCRHGYFYVFVLIFYVCAEEMKQQDFTSDLISSTLKTKTNPSILITNIKLTCDLKIQF